MMFEHDISTGACTTHFLLLSYSNGDYLDSSKFVWEILNLYTQPLYGRQYL